MQPTHLVNRINFLLADNRTQLMLAMQYDPANAASALHDEPQERYFAVYRNNRQEIESLLTQLHATELRPSEKNLLDLVLAARENYSRDGLDPVFELLQA